MEYHNVSFYYTLKRFGIFCHKLKYMVLFEKNDNIINKINLIRNDAHIWESGSH
tara:strand:- start:2252 stop:2413 length:162 start_codon:yes stop_codon:yes gene_type:complete